MKPLFATLEEVAAHNARIHQQQRERRGLGEAANEIPVLLERDLVGPIIQVLNFHEKVGGAWRANSGKFKVEGERWIVVNFKGCSDILGWLKNGARLLAVEVKRPGENPTPEQQSFIDSVNGDGGLAFVARSISDVQKALATA